MANNTKEAALLLQENTFHAPLLPLRSLQVELLSRLVETNVFNPTFDLFNVEAAKAILEHLQPQFDLFDMIIGEKPHFLLDNPTLVEKINWRQNAANALRFSRQVLIGNYDGIALCNTEFISRTMPHFAGVSSLHINSAKTSASYHSMLGAGEPVQAFSSHPNAVSRNEKRNINLSTKIVVFYSKQIQEAAERCGMNLSEEKALEAGTVEITAHEYAHALRDASHFWQSTHDTSPFLFQIFNPNPDIYLNLIPTIREVHKIHEEWWVRGIASHILLRWLSQTYGIEAASEIIAERNRIEHTAVRDLDRLYHLLQSKGVPPPEIHYAANQVKEMVNHYLKPKTLIDFYKLLAYRAPANNLIVYP